jgi:putative acetyltransferase
MKPDFSLNPRLSLREATASDLDGIVAFLGEMLKEFGLEFDYAGVDSDMEAFAESYSNGYFGLIEEENKIVGTFALFPMSDSVVELRKMYLHPRIRGMGVGRQLLRFLESTAIQGGYIRVELETATAMSSARRLYEKEGYREIEPIHNRMRCEHRYFKDLR